MIPASRYLAHDARALYDPEHPLFRNLFRRRCRSCALDAGRRYAAVRARKRRSVSGMVMARSNRLQPIEIATG